VLTCDIQNGFKGGVKKQVLIFGFYLESVIPNPTFKNSDRLCFIINIIEMHNKAKKQKEMETFFFPSHVLLICLLV